MIIALLATLLKNVASLHSPGMTTTSKDDIIRSESDHRMFVEIVHFAAHFYEPVSVKSSRVVVVSLLVIIIHVSAQLPKKKKNQT